MTDALLSVEGLERGYLLPRRTPFAARERVQAVRGVDLAIAPGESLGLVGESGCGKSTLARAVLGLERPGAGRVTLAGEDVHAPRDRRALRANMQMIFQDPYGSLDPRWTVARIVGEPLGLVSPPPRGAARRERVAEALAAVGLEARALDRYPHEFSGGQRQRVAIARALITRPKLIVADEPVSALDVSVQAQVLNLMADLQAEHGLAYLFISHDLGVVRSVTDRVAVMQAGRIVETGPTREVMARPRHDYTKTLLSAEPTLDPARRRKRKARA